MTHSEKQTLGFQTEVKQLLRLMIHSLYSNKEIFIRELISNASDAADKLRFMAIQHPEYYEGDSELKVQIELDKKSRTIRITDNGIGMSREEVIDNLGTIAKSGTREFLESLSGDTTKNTELIGQFGVGFYSAFIVSNRVIVETRHASLPSEKGVRWESSGEGEYSIEIMERSTRGTSVTLHLRETEEELLEDWHLRTLIKKYSDHITLPVLIKKIPSLDSIDKENKQPESNKPEWDQVNDATALWTLPKNQIQDEEYKAFYKYLTHDIDDPLIWSHNRVEGKNEYISLLYIPSRAPFDLWNSDAARGLKLYVKRVFIMDDAEQCLPRYLRFVKGIVDSSDLPLNISREILQSNKIIDNIRSSTTKRVLDMLTDLSKKQPEKYQKFWDTFGNSLKEGIVEDFSNRATITQLLRFSSTYDDKETQMISLEDYVKRMTPEQKKIYYITSDNFSNAQHSPHLELFRNQKTEVLLLFDRIDEWMVAHLREFEGKELQSVAKGEIDSSEISQSVKTEDVEKNENELKSFLEQIKNILGEKIKEVRLSKRLTASPACIVRDQNALSSHMERLLKASGQSVPENKPILELNPNHTFIKKLKEEPDDSILSKWAMVLFDQAMLIEGVPLEDPSSFVNRINELLLSQ